MRLLREHCHVKQDRNPSATCLYCIATVAPLLTPTYCTTTAEYARLQCELQPSQHGTTCCTAYIEAATTGLSPAMVTPSQIVVTAATAVAHTASMKRQQSRAPPAVGIACCAVHAGTTACVVKLCAASPAHVRFACECAVAVSFPGRHRSRGPTLRDIPPGTVSNGVCYLRALTAEDRPRCRHRRSCPCLVGATTGTLRAAATRISGTAVEYSHGVTLSDRSHGVLCVLTWVLIRVLTRICSE